MKHLQARKLSGDTSTLVSGSVDGLRSRLQGQVLLPGDGGYDDARTVWNAMFDRRPSLIARCRNADDVVAAVNFARENDLLCAVRGGGHNIAGHAVCDNGLVIDLSLMNSVQVDGSKRTVRVEGGALWADVDRTTQAEGLAVPNGVVSTTGVAGLTLGGGFGRLSRKFGLTIDNLISADVVSADGALIRASNDEHPDLFWALRGGGGNFGVVTAFEFRLHEVGPDVLFGPIVYSLRDAREVLRNYAGFAASAPRECSIWADLLTAPPLPFIPEQHHGTTVLFVAPFYVGDPERGRELLDPVRTYGDPVADGFGEMSYLAAQKAVDELYAPGMQNYWKAHNFVELGDAAIDAILASAGRLPTPQSDLLISHVGGAINDFDAGATAYPHRHANFVVTPGARWEPGGANDAAINWARDCWESLESTAAGGSYVNFISEGSGRARDAFDRNHDRLVEVKNRYDPRNQFRLNQNVEPGI
jgi:FAD/FMN-containing dehydrogenase